MENQAFTTIGKGHGAPCYPATREEWETLRRQPWLADMCARIEQGEESLKAKLPVWTPRCAQFRNDHRAEKDAQRPLQRLMFDVDEKGKTSVILQKMRKEEPEMGNSEGEAAEQFIGPFRVLLVEESVRRGTHILVDLPQGMKPDEAQKEFARLIGMEVDPAVKNVAGCIYMVPEDHTRYVSGELQTLTGPTSASPRGGTSSQDAPTPSGGQEAGHTEPLAQSLKAFDLCVEKAGLTAEHMDIWGENNWHQNLMSVLSVGLPKLMSREQLMAVVQTRLPNYWQFPDCKKLIDYFYDKYSAERGYMSQQLREINAQAQQEGTEEDRELDQLTRGWQLPPLPKRLPRVMELLTKNYDPRFAPMLVMASLPVLAAHASHFRGRYLNGKLTGPQQFVSIIGGSGKGKGYVTDMYLMMVQNTLMRHDKQEMQRVKENAELRERKTNSRGDKPNKYHPRLRLFETTSKSSILELQSNLGDGGMLLGHFSEADGFGKSGGSSMEVLSVLFRKAWSSEPQIQYYLSDSSCNAIAEMCASLLVCGTVKSVVQRMFSDTENGMLQRFISMVVPRSKRTFRPPKQNYLSAEESQELQDILQTLYQRDIDLGDNVEVLEMPRSSEVAGAFFDDLEVRYNDGLMTEAEADLSPRCGEFIFRAAIPLVAIEGGETREILDLIRWVGDTAFYVMCKIFGSRVAQDMSEANELLNPRADHRRTAEPLLDQMPEIFSKKELERARAAAGQSEDCRMLLSRYCKSGKLERFGRGMYRKLKSDK